MLKQAMFLAMLIAFQIPAHADWKDSALESASSLARRHDSIQSGASSEDLEKLDMQDRIARLEREEANRQYNCFHEGGPLAHCIES